MSDLVANLVYWSHFALSAFVLLTPFIGPDRWVLINLLFMLGIALHWVLNNNVCALTMLEKKLRGTQDDNSTFFGQVFGRAYTFGRDDQVCWAILVFLILVSASKVVKRHILGTFIHEFRYSALYRLFRLQ
jgi:hypothetical protein